MPDRQAPPAPISPSNPMPHTDFATPVAGAVAEILACADIAAGAIARQAEAQVREMTARAESRPAEEAARRRARLEQVRGELAERAAALAFSYGSIVEELGVIDRMLAEDDPRLAAIKMTLRERRRIHVPTGEAQVPAAPWADPDAEPSSAQEATQEIWPPARAPAPVAPTATAEVPQDVPPGVQAPRRAWRFWRRAA
jgi:hypothetical protein